MNTFFSIIIPVYNKQDSLERCINSVLSQDYSDYELILINDGSTDECLEICKRYQKNDNRIAVIDEENKGVSFARNQGLKRATGEYVLFCDADDELCENALTSIAKAITNTYSDIYVGGMEKETVDLNKGLVFLEKAFEREGSSFSRETYKDNLARVWEKNNMLSSCGKAFKNSLIKDKRIAFNEKLIVLEDFDFILQFMDNAQCVSILPENIYRVCDVRHRNSYLHRSRSDYTEDVLYVNKRMNEYLEKWDIQDTGVFWNSIKSSFGAALNSLWSLKTNSAKEKRAKYKLLSKTYRKPQFRRYTEDTKKAYSKLEYFYRYNGFIYPLVLLLKSRRII